MHWASYLTPKVEFWLTKNAAAQKGFASEGKSYAVCSPEHDLKVDLSGFSNRNRALRPLKVGLSGSLP
jgi:hypothetical protein